MKICRISTILIYTDLRYVEKLIENLEKKRSLEERYKKMRDITITKESEMRINLQRAHETLTEVSEACKVLQKEVGFSYFGRTAEFSNIQNYIKQSIIG